MEGFKNLEIKNFRGIDRLVMDDFSRVNVFLGQNGSGKSSILEAILMLTGMSNPGLPQSIIPGCKVFFPQFSVDDPS